MLSLTLTWPGGLPEERSEDFLLGVWSPDRRVEVGLDTPPPGIMPATVKGRNYALISNTAAIRGECRSLVHAMAAEGGALGFRGYLFDPPLTGWSPKQKVTAYWQGASLRSHNGVFAAAVIRDEGRRLELVTDALGVSPLYYRVVDGIVLFATSVRWLRLASDSLDRVAVRMLMQTGYIPGTRSLLDGVSRIAPGTLTVFQTSAPWAKESRWFALAPLAGGEKAIDDRAVRELEAAFQHAMDRALRLPAEHHFLPLSSGHDSRRILAALHSRRVVFQSATARAVHYEGLDLDASCAAAMARAFAFPHQVLELAPPEQFAADDRMCRLLFSGETLYHSWMPPLLRSIWTKDTLVYDGLAGDILGNGGRFMISGISDHSTPDLAKAKARGILRKSEIQQIRSVAKTLAGTSLERILRVGEWPSLDEIRAEVEAHIAAVPEGPNRLFLAILLIRTSRNPGLWSQHLLEAGQVAVHPYLELDHLCTTLSYSSLDKIETPVQERCLKACWPEYYAFPGTRRPPERPALADVEAEQGRMIARLAQLRCDAGSPRLLPGLRQLVEPRAYAALVGAAWSTDLAMRIHWWLAPLLVAVTQMRIASPCWTVTQVGNDQPNGSD